MKRLLGLALVVVAATFAVGLFNTPVSAQEGIFVSDRASGEAADVINGRVVSIQSVEVADEVFRVSEIEVTSALKGSLSGTILVQTPGGERSDGTVVYFSHTPRLVPGELVQLALTTRDDVPSDQLAIQTAGADAVYSVVRGLEGAHGLLPDGVGRASAASDYVLTGLSWATDDLPIEYYINPAGSTIGTTATVAAVRRGFDLWEDDPGSNVDFTYRGLTSRSGTNLGDGQNTISWLTTNAPYVAQARWISDGRGNTAEFDIVVNPFVAWANGAVSGRFDLGTVIAHEVGHGIGLNHPLPSSELMYGLIGSGYVKPLGLGDRAGVALLYPYTGPLCAGEPVTVNLGLGQSPTSGDDVIYGTSGADTIDALGGDDVICALGGNDTVNGGGGDDTIYGSGGDDELSGGGGADTIYGDAGDDDIMGGSEADTIHGGDGADKVSGGTGADFIYGEVGDDDLYGSDGNDTVSGGAGDDDVRGGSGNDTLNGGAGADRVLGEAGNDTINGDDGDDRLRGGNNHDTISGADGDDNIYSGSGNDLVLGGLGSDYINGGSGVDELRGGDGIDQIRGGGDDDVLLGGNDADILRGGGGDDELSGGNGDDTLHGNTGDDDLAGQSGDDRLYGSTGNDTLSGADGEDVLYGQLGDDILQGQNGDDELYGSNGDDELYGGSGDDNLNAGKGIEIVDGQADADTCYASAALPDTIINCEA